MFVAPKSYKFKLSWIQNSNFNARSTCEWYIGFKWMNEVLYSKVNSLLIWRSSVYKYFSKKSTKERSLWEIFSKKLPLWFQLLAFRKRWSRKWHKNTDTRNTGSTVAGFFRSSVSTERHVHTMVFSYIQTCYCRITQV